MYRSHSPSYLRFLRTSAERDADPGSVAVRANAEGETESTQVQSKMRHFSLEKGNTVMPSGRLPSPRSRTTGSKTALKPADYKARLMMSFNCQSLNWLPVKVRSTYKIACLCNHCHSSTAPTYVADMLHEIHRTPATLAPAHTPCLFSMDHHTVGQHLVIVHFILLLLLSGTLFQMMSGVPHHCHHLSLV